MSDDEEQTTSRISSAESDDYPTSPPSSSKSPSKKDSKRSGRKSSFKKLFGGGSSGSIKSNPKKDEKRKRGLLDELLKNDDISGSFGQVIEAAKGMWLGSAMMKPRSSQTQTFDEYVSQTAESLIKNCTDAKKSIILFSLDIFGAVDGKNREEVIMRESIRDISKIIELDDPGYFVLTTNNPILHASHIHVFALKRAQEGPTLRRALQDILPTPDSDNEDDEDDTDDDEVVVFAHYLGNALVSTAKWWAQPVLKELRSAHRGGNTMEVLAESASVVLCQPYAQKKTSPLLDPSGVVVSKEHIQVLDGLTQTELCTIRTIHVCQVVCLDLPVNTDAIVSPQKRSSSADHDDISDDDDYEVVCLCLKDEQLNTINVSVFLCSSTEKAHLLADSVQQKAEAAVHQRDDPFKPNAGTSPSPSKVVEKYELDRETLTAVKLVGHGEFGEVYLATQAMYKKIETGGDTDLDTVGEFGEEIEVQRAIKIASSKKAQHIQEFVDEVELQIVLKHESIVQVVGVCMVESPYLAVLEFMLYGDLKKVLQTLKEKDMVLAECEMVHIAKQVAGAMAYVTEQRIVHLDLAARNCLVHSNSTVKLADFGLARHYSEGLDAFELRGSMKIPFLWCPPECFPKQMYDPSLEKAKYTPHFNERSDMWAFGVVLWEIASGGQQPYGALPLLTALKLIDMQGRRLEWPEGQSPLLKGLMDKCFSLEPSERPTFTYVEAQLLANKPSGTIRDIGELLNGKLAEKVRRMSSMAVSQRRESSTSMAEFPGTPSSPALESINEDEELGEIQDGTEKMSLEHPAQRFTDFEFSRQDTLKGGVLRRKRKGKNKDQDDALGPIQEKLKDETTTSKKRSKARSSRDFFNESQEGNNSDDSDMEM